MSSVLFRTRCLQLLNIDLSAGRLRGFNRSSRSLLVAALALASATLPAQIAQAQRATRVISSAVDAPIAVRGGVLMLPLAPQRPITGWPSTADIMLADGRRVEGTVAWIYPAVQVTDVSGQRSAVSGQRGAVGSPLTSDLGPRTSESLWTSDPRKLAVRLIHHLDDPAKGQPILLAQMPENIDGTLRLGRQAIRPVWVEKGVLSSEWSLSAVAGVPSNEAQAPGAQHSTLSTQHSAFGTLSAPDPHSPFEYWRAALLADRLGIDSPPLDEMNPAAALLAQHYADLWRAGLSRVAEPPMNRPSLAAELRDRLTRICVDRRTSTETHFAAWLSEPNETNRLLAALLEAIDARAGTRRAVAAGAAVQNWLNAQPDLMVWFEREYGDQVRLAVVNVQPHPVVARFTWRGTSEYPIAVEIPPGQVTAVTLDRPEQPTAAAQFGSVQQQIAAEVLRIESDSGAIDIPCSPRIAVVRAPGLLLPPPRGPMTLGEAEGWAAPILGNPDHAVAAQVRRLQGRWELFVQARRAEADASDESFTLYLGPDDEDGGAHTILVVPETGWHRVERGTNDGTLQVHRRSFDDRWHCRIVLPDAWLRMLPGDTTLVGLSHRSAAGLRITPGESPPWRMIPGRIALDLSEWLDVPE